MTKQILLSVGFVILLGLIVSANFLLEKYSLVKPFASDETINTLLANQAQTKQSFSGISQSSRTLIHINQPWCICNSFTSSHVLNLDKLATAQSIKTINVELGELSADQQSKDWQNLLSLIPSTPATVLLNDSGNIEYIGPYSSGLTCNSGNSFIEQFLKQEQSDKTIANWISTGCYCSVK
ncbi:DUF6436 domain-containing protein [Marinicellulosiphila megalodicopiae]|uniref:DUF6436 domain-containing protein n=1 Tax=Marinicellulosiphila megalodicopiae TaxID=2724896 RepID=UPI003BB1C71C